ncbi:MAG: glutamine-hydrolyzing carbamoyl-phosphate synthase small subunit [Deltaproteobacteria bacterium]|nr:glutamine-hydrolyzing carbamoyl-phosphate synthase small subunit [Deltaproteobacteria bacterium]
MSSKKKALLALSDGTVYEGHSLGSEGEALGEVVFNTSMTGYQEILTDPSYKGQMVTMTYPQIGNYGTNVEDVESHRPWAEGFIVKDPCDEPSSWRHRKEGGLTLDEYLKANKIVGIYGIDTRSLVRRLRDKGAMEGVISTVDTKAESLVHKARTSPGLVGRDLVKEVTCKKPYKLEEGLWEIEGGYAKGIEKKFKVVAFDFGMKRNIVRNLLNVGCDVTVVPASTSADEVLSMNPDGVFLSNGPGDPEPVTYAQETIKKLIGKKPIFGICLGHQLLSLAIGARTYKLKFGHRGGNQPVKDFTTGRVEITSQNHGFAVDAEPIKKTADITHINLNDQTNEGIADKAGRFFSVQYHPESSPGPHDSMYLFKRFADMMEG